MRSKDQRIATIISLFHFHSRSAYNSLKVTLFNHMPLVKVKTKSQVTIPDAIRRQLGVEVGDVLEAMVQKGSIVLRPKAVVDRDEYTPEQRRRINVQLAKSVAEFKQGKSFGPFETHRDMIDFLHRQAERPHPRKATTKRRAR